MQVSVTCNKKSQKDDAGKTVLVSREKPIKMLFDYEVGANLKAAIQLFGEDVVFTQYEASARISLQNTARTMLEGGSTEAQVHTAMETHKLGVKTARVAKDPKPDTLSYLASMTPAEAARIVAEAEAMRKNASS